MQKDWENIDRIGIRSIRVTLFLVAMEVNVSKTLYKSKIRWWNFLQLSRVRGRKEAVGVKIQKCSECPKTHFGFEIESDEYFFQNDWLWEHKGIWVGTRLQVTQGYEWRKGLSRYKGMSGHSLPVYNTSIPSFIPTTKMMSMQAHLHPYLLVPFHPLTPLHLIMLLCPLMLTCVLAPTCDLVPICTLASTCALVPGCTIVLTCALESTCILVPLNPICTYKYTQATR